MKASFFFITVFTSIILFSFFSNAQTDLTSFESKVAEIYKGNILIIDWLQWVPIDHPNSRIYLRRDLENICTYFTKKFKIESNVDEILNSFYKK